jgi:hypothetical protein
VNVRYDRIAMHSRVNDGDPHYGGAELQNLTIGAECTSGLPHAIGRAGVGHGGEESLLGALGEAVFSGSEYYVTHCRQNI